MLSDELLSKVSDENYFYGLTALTAVIRQHAESVEWKDIPAGICIECGEKYPCPTIETIQRELIYV